MSPVSIPQGPQLGLWIDENSGVISKRIVLRCLVSYSGQPGFPLVAKETRAPCMASVSWESLTLEWKTIESSSAAACSADASGLFFVTVSSVSVITEPFLLNTRLRLPSRDIRGIFSR